jgi:hypothetical protein
MAAEIRQSIGLFWFQTIDGLGKHQSQPVLARTLRTREDQSLGKVSAANAFAQMRYGRSVAMEGLETHPSSLRHW